MTTLHHQILVEAPIDAVWQAIAGDLTAVEHYNPTVASARFLSSQREGVGAARRCELKPKGFVEERVWEWTAKKSIGIEVVASEWPIVFMKWKTELTPDAKGTLVTQEMTYKLKFGVAGLLLDALVMRRKLNGGIRDIFTRLKTYAEQNTRA